MRFSYLHGDDQHDLDLEPAADGYRASIGDQRFSVQVLPSMDGTLQLLIDGKPVAAFLAAEGRRRYVWVDGKSFSFEKASSGARAGRVSEELDEGLLRAPMPGQVQQVRVREGEAVEKGQTLLLLEAMKMEIRIQSSRAGKVAKLHVAEGASVEKDAVLIEITAQTE